MFAITAELSLNEDIERQKAERYIATVNALNGLEIKILDGKAALLLSIKKYEPAKNTRLGEKMFLKGISLLVFGVGKLEESCMPTISSLSLCTPSFARRYQMVGRSA